MFSLVEQAMNSAAF